MLSLTRSFLPTAARVAAGRAFPAATVRRLSQKPSDTPEDPAAAAAPEDPAAPTPEEPAADRSAPRERSAPDGLPKSAYISTTDRRRNAMAKYSAWASLSAVAGGFLLLGRALDEDEQRAHPGVGAGWDAYYDRVKARTNDFLSFYAEPPSTKLLPERSEFSRPYTLVLALEDLLIHSEWTRDHGWRIAKRPGLDYFLAYLFQYYEIVIFTSQPDAVVAPIIAKLDPQPGFLSGHLFRADTRYVDGKYVKDLNYLNRDLSKVVMIETNPDAWSANPDNTIKLAPWKGGKNDELVALIPFLEYIPAMGVADVRPVIKAYDGTDIPLEFARREELQREQLRKELGSKGRKKPEPPAWVMGMLGMKPSEAKEPEVKTFMDRARETGHMNYLAQIKHIEDHKEEFQIGRAHV